jgi:hypothetical protein
VAAHVDVEAEVSVVPSFMQDTNSVVLVGEGITTPPHSVMQEAAE